MKKTAQLAALICSCFCSYTMANPTQAAPASIKEDLLTGDTRLACEAVLCLSTGNRPSECQPSIRRYFSIKHKRLRDTLKARKNFLKLCPSSNEQGMPGLINALAEGAGRCDAAELNRVMRATYQTQQCYHRSNKAGGSYCVPQRVSYVRNAKPAYCKAYFDHEWTIADESIRYEGEEKKGGRWVDVR